ncbi:MAG TPA: DinB family protein [Terriglobia bacterium]|nr:DinB family protein [Terriglobia bacterium]
MTPEILNIAHQFKTNTGLFKRTTEGIPRERWLEKPGKDSNHLLWVAGHVTFSRGQIVNTLGTPWTDPWAGLFAGGTKPAEQNSYPDPVEIARVWDEVSEKLAAALEAATPEALAKPAPAGRAPQFDGLVSGKIAFLSLHEAYHMGQMGFLRKWLGYGQTVG